jgi:TolB protein
MRSFSFIALIVTTLCLIICPLQGHAKIYLDFSAPTIRKLPVAIQTFMNLNPVPEDAAIGKELHETISDDLAFSGLFDILDPISFIEDPETSETEPAKIHFPDWTAVGADILIKGVYSRNNDQLKIEFHLYDVITQKEVIGKRYYGKIKDIRKIAHKFANEMVKQITGEEGVFDTRIVYLSSSNGMNEIHIMDYDGHNDQLLLQEKPIIISPRWSTDGEKILFTSYREGNPDLFQITIRTGSIQKISGEPGINTGGCYSPGGGRLAYVMSKDGNPEIYVLDKYSRRPKRLTENWATDVSPVWSPDGKEVSFMSDRAGSPQVYVMDYKGKNPRRITFQGKYNATPAWSPRGDRIAFSSMVDGHFQIATVKPDGSQMHIVTANAGNNEYPFWSPGGRFLCFSSTMDGKSDIYIMNANGANLRRVTSNSARNTAPNWSPSIFFE